MKRIVFVCVENSCRSQIAEAFARLHSPGDIEIYSSGSRPSGAVNEKAIASMAEVNYDLTKHTSKSLNEIPDAMYDAVITMGCGDECPSLRAVRREDWGIPDPKHLPLEDFRAVRDAIEARVKTLLSEISESERS
jgi:protein-tyrosine-phosphatase